MDQGGDKLDPSMSPVINIYSYITMISRYYQYCNTDYFVAVAFIFDRYQQSCGETIVKFAYDSPESMDPLANAEMTLVSKLTNGAAANFINSSPQDKISAISQPTFSNTFM